MRGNPNVYELPADQYVTDCGEVTVMPGMSEVVALYMNGDEIASLSTSTQKRTRTALSGLIKITGPKMIVSKVSRSHADQCVAAWRARGLTESTVNAYKIVLRGFGAYLFETRLNRVDPCKHLKIVKTKANLAKRVPLTDDQVVKLIKAADLFSDRDGVTVRILLATGLRSSEVTGLTWADIDLDGRTVRAWRPKVKDHHYVPMIPALVTILTGWKARYEAFCGPIKPGWYVVPALATDQPFMAVSGWSLVPTVPQTNLIRRMKRFYTIIGVEDLVGKGVHTMRRTSAGRLFEATNDITVVQDLLGHTSPTQTASYISVDIRQARLRDAMQHMEL